MVLIGAPASLVAYVAGLDTLIAMNGTVTQGDLVSSNFGARCSTNPLIHGVQQTPDPASTATGRNALVRSVDSLGRESQ